MRLGTSVAESYTHSGKAGLQEFVGPDRLLDTLERHSFKCVSVLLVIFMAVAALKAARTFLWFDEIVTFLVAQQPSPAQVIRAIREGCDVAPPLYALLVKSVQSVVGPGELATRLPSLVGFCTMCLCVFVFARRRMSPVYAMLAMLVAMSGAIRYVAEGRPYGLVLGCVSLALVCWQSAAEGEKRWLSIPVLALSLAIGTAAHYFTVFVLLSLFVGEVARWRATRKFDLAVLAALTTPALVLLAHLPLIEAGRVFVNHYALKVNWSSPGDAYEFFFSRVLVDGVPFGVLCYLVLTLLSRPETERERPLDNPRLLPHEYAATIVLALLPLLVALSASLTTPIFYPRYVMSTVIGVAILTPVAIHRMARGSRLVVFSALVASLAFISGRVIHDLKWPWQTDEGWLLNGDLATPPPSKLPIVITQQHAYLEAWFYAPEPLRGRILHVNDAELDRRYLGQDSNALNFAALSHRSPLRAPDYKTFRATVRHFFLVTDGKGWLPSELLKCGYSLRLIRQSSIADLFEVRSP